MRRAFNTLYGRSPDGQGDSSRTTASGEQGEYVEVTLNNFATLVTQVTVRTTANKPAFKAIATNADSASLEQASFGQGLLEFYSNTHSVQDRDYEMVEIGNVCSEGWEIYGWDATAGKNLTDFQEGEALNEGDAEVHSTTPFRVAYDYDVENVDRLQWGAFKRRYNRFDLAKSMETRDPEVSAKLLDMAGDTGLRGDWDSGEDDLELGNRNGNSSVSADRVWVWEFRHLPTAALPNGRLLRFVTADCVLYDGIYPYDAKELHMHRYCPSTVIGSIAGHAPAFDLLGLQELKDTVATQAASAANAGGITNLWVPLGDKPEVLQVAGSMNFLQSKNEPKPIKGVELSAQIPDFDRMLDSNMQARMGESDVSMGNVPKGMPGNLAALLEAKTVQYNSRGQASYARVLERSRTGLLKLLKQFAKSDRVAVLGGIEKGYEHKTWSSKDLSGIDRFVVESVSPLTQTHSGKMDSAKELLDHGMISDPKQYLLLKETGRLEPLLESDTAMLMGIRQEKQMILKGIGLAPVDPAKSFASGLPVFVDDGKEHIIPLIYDRHWECILEDLGAIAVSQTRKDPKIVSAAMGVVEERVRLMKKVDPVMLSVLGYPGAMPLAQALMMSSGMSPPGASGATPGVPAGTPDEARSPEVAGLPAGAPRIASPKPAKPPPNPLTGEQSPSPTNGVPIA